jgi:uncharacterized protein
VGFLKITGGTNPLDSTWIHPESYSVAEKVLERLGASPAELGNRLQAESLGERVEAIDLDGLSRELGVGRLLLSDIVEQLARPGRDPREDLPKPFFKKGVLKLEDLEVGMELLGSVLNVVDFGAFVDIGLHDSGLVHISQLSDQYVRDPHDVISVGQIVQVWVLELDKARRRVSLTMIPPEARERQQQREDARREQKERKARRATEAVEKAAGGEGPSARPPRPPRQRPQRGDRQPRQPQPRVYESKPKAPPAALSKEMREGKEPLRTFGDLKQFLEKKNGAEADEGGSAEPGA